MSIEEKFRDYDARIRAVGVNAQPADYFKAGYIFGGCAEADKLNATRKLANQLSIALGKYAAGYRPGQEGWAPEDQESLDWAMGGHKLRNLHLEERGR